MCSKTDERTHTHRENGYKIQFKLSPNIKYFANDFLLFIKFCIECLGAWNVVSVGALMSNENMGGVTNLGQTWHDFWYW